EGLQVYHRGEDPTAIADCVMSSFNGITRIGGATCLPGDIVLCTMSGVIFIPAHMAEEIVDNAEKSQVRDIWGFEMLASGKYTGAQIDTRWTVALMEEFLEWTKVSPKAKPYAHLNWAKDLEDLKKSWEENPTGMPTVAL
ncbi:MAG: hypothetical protein LBD02_09870, partial [Christensenellaceae bacterium]|nr:hypothetical protein [Christensenellaceae bacterium]